MRSIVSYVWATQFFADHGGPGRGKRLFTQKNCAACHEVSSSGAPSLAHGKNAYSSVTMVVALWKHGPRMLSAWSKNTFHGRTFRAGRCLT
jgi:mono/diheme cytochrome c family protein